MGAFASKICGSLPSMKFNIASTCSCCKKQIQVTNIVINNDEDIRHVTELFKTMNHTEHVIVSKSELFTAKDGTELISSSGVV